MEQLIRELYHPANQSSPERVNEIQRQIQLIQRQKTAWQLGIDLLDNDEAVVRFYGALTLTIKINADWENDDIAKDDRMRTYLLEALVTHYIRLATLPDANFVLQKLCSTLLTLFARPDSGWILPVRHILTCILSGRYVPPTDLPEVLQLFEAAQNCSYSQLKAIVMITTTMAEDLTTTSTNNNAKDDSNIQERLSGNCYDSWQLFKFCIDLLLEVSSNSASPHQNASAHIFSSSNSVEFFKLIMKAIPFWTSLIRHGHAHLDQAQRQQIESIAKYCIQLTLKAFTTDDLVAGILQMLITMQQSSSKFLREAVPDFPISISTSPKAQELVNALSSGDFSSDAILYVDFLESVIGQVDTTNSDYLHEDCYRVVLQSLQSLLRCKGVPGIDDPVCQIVLEKLSEMVEGYTDWEEDKDAQALLTAFAADACQACLMKVQLPPEQMSSATQDWDADDRARFQDFRYDVQDFFQSAFALLGNSLIEGIVNTVLVQDNTPNWSTFEAGIFSLTAFSDTMSSEPDGYDGLITTILGSQGWSFILHSSGDVPDRARQTAIRFITENVAYLQRHSDSLVLILNFLFSSLHMQASASSASRAIYNLCDSHRRSLAGGLPQFMVSLGSIADLEEAEKHRIYAAVAAVIQALPTEDAKVRPILQLLSSASEPLAALHASSPDRPELLRVCSDVIQTLASIGKGLRTPADIPVDLDSAAHEESMFWCSGPGQACQADVLSIYSSATQKLDGQVDNVFVEACCDFIRSGFTEEHPSPFKFLDDVSLDLVIRLIDLENPSIDYTMACASGFIASVEASKIHIYIRGLLYPIISGQQRILAEFQQTRQTLNSTFASSSLDFLSRLMTKWGYVWGEMQDSEGTIGVAIELSLRLLADPDTLPRRSAASFFTSFVDLSGAKTGFGSEAESRLNRALHQYAPRILALVLRLLGGECARSELESITETLKRFIQKQFMVTKQVLKEAIKDERGVLSEKALKATTVEQRSRFLAQVEGLRGSRKTNDIVKDFWIACKGSGFGYIA